MNDLNSQNQNNEPRKDNTNSRENSAPQDSKITPLDSDISESSQSSLTRAIATDTLEKVIRGYTESTLFDLGLANPKVADYLSEIQINNIRQDVLYNRKDMSKLQTGVELLRSAALQQDEERVISICQKVGDSTLLISAIFPYSIQPQGYEAVVEYRNVGKFAYASAHRFSERLGYENTPIFEILFSHFDLLCYALNETNKRIQAAA